jgi:hypothetical protein
MTAHQAAYRAMRKGKALGCRPFFAVSIEAFCQFPAVNARLHESELSRAGTSCYHFRAISAVH